MGLVCEGNRLRPRTLFLDPVGVLVANVGNPNEVFVPTVT